MKNKIFDTIEWFIIALGFVLFIGYVVNGNEATNLRWDVYLDYNNLLIEGFKNTIIISIVCFILAFIFGFILFLMLQSKFGFLKKLAYAITEIAMGTPLLVLVIIFPYFIGSSFSYDNKLFWGILAIVFYSGPYISNILNGAVNSIDKDQFVLIEFYDLNVFQKYFYIIIPQIIKQITPGMIGNLSMIIKGTALLNVLSIGEIFFEVKLIQSKTYAFTEGYIVMWIMYLLITIPLSLLTKYAEKRLSWK